MDTETLAGKTVSKTWNEYPDFNVGDVVKLKSGGPNMTIDGNGGSRFSCAWFDAGNTYHQQSFHQGSLQKVTKDPDLSPA